MLYYIIIAAMTLTGAFASLFFKKASGCGGLKMLFNPNLYLGGGLYLLAAFANIYVLKFLPYSVVLPLTSLTYIWTMAISYLVLKENISKKKITGVLLIITGAVLLAIG